MVQVNGEKQSVWRNGQRNDHNVNGILKHGEPSTGNWVCVKLDALICDILPPKRKVPESDAGSVGVVHRRSAHSSSTALQYALTHFITFYKSPFIATKVCSSFLTASASQCRSGSYGIPKHKRRFGVQLGRSEIHTFLSRLD